MSYNTTTIANVFSFLYTPLRRAYTQYAFNYSSRQYFMYANVVLKRPDRIPFYYTVSGAFEKRNPDGYLPTDISPYYFKERPIYFYNAQLFVESKILGKANTYNITTNPPFIILNLFLDGSYRDVFLNYDSSKMNIEMNVMDALVFVNDEVKVTNLQKALNNVITQLSIAYNQVVLLEQAKAQGRYSNDNFLYRSTYGAKVLVEKWISSLQNDSRFVVKVCRECNNNAQLGMLTAPLTYITMAGALSLTWLTTKYSQYNSVNTYLQELLIEVERLRVGLDREWKIANDPNYKPPVDQQEVKPMDTVTVTAKKNNAWGWLIAAAAVGLVVTGNNNGSKK